LGSVFIGNTRGRRRESRVIIRLITAQELDC
jgi:hypothetical protein